MLHQQTPILISFPGRGASDHKYLQQYEKLPDGAQRQDHAKKAVYYQGSQRRVEEHLPSLTLKAHVFR